MLDAILEKRRRRWPVTAQGWSARDNPGAPNIKKSNNPERVCLKGEPFQGLNALYVLDPGFSFLEPWAEI